MFNGGIVRRRFLDCCLISHLLQIMEGVEAQGPHSQRTTLDLDSSLQSTGSQWSPSQLGFGPFLQQSEVAAKPQNLPVVMRKPLVTRLTKDIVKTYQKCNPKFTYSEESNPKKYLTSPSSGVLNDGYDNVNSDLILRENLFLFNSDAHRRYIVKDLLGHGTFGQVAKCLVAENNRFVAVKIIKNQPAYYQQALVEVSILTMLNKKHDPEDKHHIVRIYDYFVHQRHLCICFELLDTNLYELIKSNHFRGLSLNIVQMFSKQILCGLALLKDAGIIHCDLKPENILLCTRRYNSLKPAEVKIIDFGSACMEDHTVYSYIQSRYYRSPEVLLGYQYTTTIDMWSFGCIVAELFLGLPLFPGASEFDLLRRMINILGGQPPDYVLKEAKNTKKFFKCIGAFHSIGNDEISTSNRSSFQVLTVEEYESRELKKPLIAKEYFNHMNLEAIVTNYPYIKNLPKEDIQKESQIRLALIDFLRGLVELDPAKRWSPLQASKHPFVTGEAFTRPYKPPPETRHMPVAQNIRVEHHPVAGHWFAAGLSPNIPGRRVMQYSPHFQMAQFSNANSYGSLGSYGSYNDSVGLGSSYGSYGDNSNMLPYYSPVGPSTMNIHGNLSMLGSSPDAWRRVVHLSHGNGIGVSPSAGSFTTLPLGSSPSQFTSPNTYTQVPFGPGGQFGPSSPSRGNFQGSPLGKMAAVSQFNRRTSWGCHIPSSSQWQQQFEDGSTVSQSAESSLIHGDSSCYQQSSSNAMSLKQQRGAIGINSSIQNSSRSFFPSSNMQHSQPMDITRDKSEMNLALPDPGDWDPNYSDELLLQDDSSEISTITSALSKGMHLGSAESSAGTARLISTSSTDAKYSIHRQNEPVQGFSHAEVGSPSSSFEMLISYPGSISKPSHFMSHYPHNSLSRLGQQSLQGFNSGRSTKFQGSEWKKVNIHPSPPSNFNSGDPPSPRGRRASYHVTSIPPTSRGRKDYGRIL